MRFRKTCHVPMSPGVTDAFTLGPRAVARVAAAMWISCGGLVGVAIPLVAAGDDSHRGAMVAIGGAAVLFGALVWHLPWDRWSPSTTLVLVPAAFTAIALYNTAAVNPWSYDVFFLIAFAWIGLAHRPGTATLCTPLLLAAYLLPLLRWDHPGDGVASLVYVAPASVLLGEAVSLVATRLRTAEVDRARSEARYSALVRSSAEFVVVLDDDGAVEFAGGAVAEVLGVDPDDFVGTASAAVVHEDDLPLVESTFDAIAAGAALEGPILFRCRHADGTMRWVEGTIKNLRDDPSVGGIVVNGRDITPRIEAEERLAHLARHDPLTELPNRAAVLEDLGRALARAERVGGSVAVLFLDLDGFKVVNDSLGHAVGDQLLVAVATVLRGELREGDLLARLGGDEFTVIVEGVTDPDEPAALAQRMIEVLRQPIEVAERRHVVTVSIGIAFSGDGDRDPADLLRRADLAMYRAKELGKSRLEVFDPGLARRAHRRLDVAADLRLAVERGELDLFFQPEVELATGRVVGLEALVRWWHPERGLLLPGEFIDVAEESELILALGWQVLDRACATAARWVERLGPAAPEVSVNVSPRQLHDLGFVDDVRRAVETHRLPPSKLRLEIVERAMLDAVAPFSLTELRQMGVRLAIDDFGTGYSSLSYLDRLPVDVVKIDRSFLAPVVAATDRAPVVEATLAMARSFELDVVAEGVETEAQVAFLRRVGCPRAQGYHFGRPEPVRTAAQWLGGSLGRPGALSR